MFSERLAVFLKGLLGAVLPDAFLFGGIAAIVYGIHMMNVPGSFIAGGAAAVLIGLASSTKK
jgi:hypothetical protein